MGFAASQPPEPNPLWGLVDQKSRQAVEHTLSLHLTEICYPTTKARTHDACSIIGSGVEFRVHEEQPGYRCAVLEHSKFDGADVTETSANNTMTLRSPCRTEAV